MVSMNPPQNDILKTYKLRKCDVIEYEVMSYYIMCRAGGSSVARHEAGPARAALAHGQHAALH